MTHSPRIIAATLSLVKEKNILLNLLHKGYESGSTILLAHGPHQLQFDKPKDWPHTETTIRVLFKDAGKLWNYFTVEINAATADALITTAPSTLYRLQRRSHFRVETPRGTQAGFVHKGNAFTAIDIQDISGGGVQLRSRFRLPLSPEEAINDISLCIPGGLALVTPSEEGDLVISIRQGRIARVSEEDGAFCYGVDLKCQRKEEELLLRYVRQRELELLRKGLNL